MFVFVDLNQLRVMPEEQLKAFLVRVRDDGINAGASARSFDLSRQMKIDVSNDFLRNFEKSFPGFLKESTENYSMQLKHAENSGFANAFRRLGKFKYAPPDISEFNAIFEKELDQRSFDDLEKQLVFESLADTIVTFLNTVVSDLEKAKETPNVIS